jgi:hypothetical protein
MLLVWSIGCAAGYTFSASTDRKVRDAPLNRSTSFALMSMPESLSTISARAAAWCRLGKQRYRSVLSGPPDCCP